LKISLGFGETSGAAAAFLQRVCGATLPTIHTG
jgi:hypothetical protein